MNELNDTHSSDVYSNDIQLKATDLSIILHGFQWNYHKALYILLLFYWFNTSLVSLLIVFRLFGRILWPDFRNNYKNYYSFKVCIYCNFMFVHTFLKCGSSKNKTTYISFIIFCILLGMTQRKPFVYMQFKYYILF